jgi:tetratricopeptide (TPR) repeat protein
MINLVAEPGVGKTRVVQEMYRWLAAQDRYWPFALVGLNQRKTVIPARTTWHGEPRFFWLGLSCFAVHGTRPWPVLEDALKRQLQVHARALLIRRHRTSAAKHAAVRVATSLSGLIGGEAIRAVVELLDTGSEAREIVTALSAAERSNAAVADSDIVRATIDLADLINANGCPMVVILDDAHDADASTLSAVECLLESSRGVLVVATSWPTAVARQRREGSGYGAWLQRVAPNHRVENLRLEHLTTEALADIAVSAARSRQFGNVDREAALVLAERARGNALMLFHLLEVASANALMLHAEFRGRLALLPSEPKGIFEEVWKRFLPEDVRQVLEVVAVLDTPVHEQLLIAATRVLAKTNPASVRRTIDSALELGWLASIPDPYSEDQSMRFTEPLHGEVAGGYATQLIDSSREGLVDAAVDQALDLPTRTSYHARVGAVRHAVELLEQRLPIVTSPQTVIAFVLLSHLLRNSDRRRAAQLMDLAVWAHDQLGLDPDPKLLLDTSNAWQSLGDFDTALAVFDSALPLMFAIKAYEAQTMERYEEALDAVRDGLAAEIAMPGSVAAMPFDGRWVTVLLTEILIGIYLFNYMDPLGSEAKSLFWATAKRLAATNRLLEASAIVALANENTIMWGKADTKWLKHAGLQYVDPPADQDADVMNLTPLEEARVRLSEDRLEEAGRALEFCSGIESPPAVTLAEQLVRMGGSEYAQRLGTVAMRAGEFPQAAVCFEQALQYRLEGGPPDDPGLQPLRSELTKALVKANQTEEALTQAAQDLEIAEVTHQPRGIALALMGFGQAYLALGEYAKAQEVALRAHDYFGHDGTTKGRNFFENLSILCDALGAQRSWLGIAEALDGIAWSLMMGDAPYYRRVRGWSAVAQWRLYGEAYEERLIVKAKMKPKPWTLKAARRALEYLAAGMAKTAGGASMSLLVDMRGWLVETLLDAGHETDALRIQGQRPWAERLALRATGTLRHARRRVL